MRCIGMCGVNSAAGTYSCNSGLFGAITHNGVGDNSITLNAPQDATEFIAYAIASDDVPNVGGELGIHFSVVHVNDTTIRVYCGREPAGGGASAANDTNFCLAAYSLRGEYLHA